MSLRSERMKELWKNPKYREHMRVVHIGQKAWNKGMKATPELRQRLSELRLGVKLSEETIRKIRQSNLGKYHPPITEAHKQRLREIMTGKPGRARGHTWKMLEEAKRKISLALSGKPKKAVVGYRGIHSWIVLQHGQPDKCEECGKDGLSGRAIHWANISGKYLREREDWRRLCAKCHGEFDTINRRRKKILI